MTSNTKQQKKRTSTNNAAREKFLIAIGTIVGFIILIPIDFFYWPLKTAFGKFRRAKQWFSHEQNWREDNLNEYCEIMRLKRQCSLFIKKYFTPIFNEAGRPIAMYRTRCFHWLLGGNNFETLGECATFQFSNPLESNRCSLKGVCLGDNKYVLSTTMNLEGKSNFIGDRKIKKIKCIGSCLYKVETM